MAEGLGRFCHLHNAPPPPRVPFLCAPLPLPISLAFCPSALFFLCQLILWLRKEGSWGWGRLLSAPRQSQSPPTWAWVSSWIPIPTPLQCPPRGHRRMPAVLSPFFLLLQKASSCPIPWARGDTFNMTVHFCVGPWPPQPPGGSHPRLS